MHDLSPDEILGYVPQKEPFRFIDEILYVDDESIEGAYRFRPESDFYRGHFPGNPVTPGVILIECLAQLSVVSHAIYTAAKDRAEGDDRFQMLFSDANVEFNQVVKPGQRVIVKAKKRFWRRGKYSATAQMEFEDGTLVCSGVLSGIVVGENK